MNGIKVAGLINLVGYMIGIALYAMLLAIVLRHPAQSVSAPDSARAGLRVTLSTNGLMLVTSVLGVLWNVGALATYGLKGFGLGLTGAYPVLFAISLTALGFLPAVVVQSVLLNTVNQTERKSSRAISIAAYCLSTI